MNTDNPNITIFVIGGLSLIVGIIIFILHIIDKNHHKNPCNFLYC